MNIYLGNLNFKVKAEDLTALVQQYGSVANARIITDRETGRSRGFGFVEMDDEEALAAIEALNEQEFMGRKLVANALSHPPSSTRRGIPMKNRSIRSAGEQSAPQRAQQLGCVEPECEGAEPVQ